MIGLFCSLPSALAQQTSITNVHFPNSLLYDLETDSTLPPATVTATISYSGAQSGYYLQAGIFQLDDGSLVKGSASASPEKCIQNTSETYAACTVPVMSPVGMGDFSFLLQSRPKRLWDLALVAILENSSLSILDNSESDYSFTINVSIALTLHITVPNPVTITVDEINQSQGSVNLSLVTGPHNVTVPEIVQVNSDTRLKFEGWSDGLTSANRTILLNHYVSLEAIYINQYFLAIESSASVSGFGWYDQGTNAPFSVHSTIQPMVGVLGLLGGRLEFQGWYDHDQLITTAETGSIQMNAAHSIQARWYANYTIPAALLISTIILFTYEIVSYKGKPHRLNTKPRARRKYS
jgi:hypothetical protein